MKAMTGVFTIASLLVPMFASAAGLICSGDETSLKIEGSLEVGQTVHATFINTDSAFGQHVEITCQIEKTVSGIYCVDDEIGANYVLTLSDLGSKRIVFTEQDHGGYSSQQFDFPMTCTN